MGIFFDISISFIEIEEVEEVDRPWKENGNKQTKTLRGREVRAEYMFFLKEIAAKIIM